MSQPWYMALIVGIISIVQTAVQEIIRKRQAPKAHDAVAAMVMKKINGGLASLRPTPIDGPRKDA